MITITVYGTPQPAGSKKGFVIHPKNGGKPRAVVTDDNKRSKPWKDQVGQQAGLAMAQREMMRGPLELGLVFIVKRPQGHYGTGRNAGSVRASAPSFPTVKPDVLKLARGVEDALSGVVYNDDAQIVSEYLHKRYGSPERVEIHVRPMEPEEAETAGDVEQMTLLSDPQEEEGLPV